MIKRNLSLLLVFCLLLGCAACGTNKPANNTAEETMKVDEAIDSNEAFKKKVDDDVAIDADGKKRIDADNAAVDADEKKRIDADDSAIDSDEMMKKRFKYVETKKKIDDGSVME